MNFFKHFLNIMITMEQCFLAQLLFDLLLIEVNLTSSFLAYVQNLCVVGSLVLFAVPVVLVVVLDVHQKVQICFQCGFFFLRKEIQHFLLHFLNSVQFLIYVGKRRSYKEHGRITQKWIQLCLSHYSVLPDSCPEKA